MNAPSDDILDIVVLEPKEPITSVIFWLLVAAILIIAFAIGLWSFLRHRARKKAVPPPEIRVADALKKLRVEREQLEPNRFSLRLSGALKDFLTEKYEDPVRYETTQEFLERISERGSCLPEAAQNSLHEFLVASDELKFGNPVDAAEKTEPLLLKASEVIQNCRPLPPIQRS